MSDQNSDPLRTVTLHTFRRENTEFLRIWKINSRLLRPKAKIEKQMPHENKSIDTIKTEWEYNRSRRQLV